MRDYHQAKHELTAILDRHAITMELRPIPKRDPKGLGGNGPWHSRMTHYSVRLLVPWPGVDTPATHTLEYSQGPGLEERGEPRLVDVIGCCLFDIAGLYDMDPLAPFEEWCEAVEHDTGTPVLDLYGIGNPAHLYGVWEHLRARLRFMRIALGDDLGPALLLAGDL